MELHVMGNQFKHKIPIIKIWINNHQWCVVIFFAIINHLLTLRVDQLSRKRGRPL